MNDGWLVTSPEAMSWLKGRDCKLGAVMAALGPLRRQTRPDPFTGLLHAVVGQQISSRAHASVWARFEQLHAPFNAEKIAALPVAAIRAAGISARKGEYMLGIAREFAAGRMDRLVELDDAELLDRLMRLRGVGRWTAEMLLIFTFRRMNILSYGDKAIHKGMRLLYGHERITPAIFAACHERYAPFASIASLYLWEVAESNAKGLN